MTVGKVTAVVGGLLLVGVIGAVAFGLPAGGETTLDAGGFMLQAPTFFDVQGEGDYVLLQMPEKEISVETFEAEKVQESILERLNSRAGLESSYGFCVGHSGGL